MIYGNTGAGLVDVNIPENPLYKSALPDLKAVSASAWGLPSLDDIAVPKVETEKDIQTDTELTDKYFDLAQKLKDYAIKGKAVGIDVTKPKNNPTHLQYASEWNKMYQDFLQTGKELKTGRQNQQQLEKLKLSPNSIVGNPDAHQVLTNELLGKYSLEAPFEGFKGLQEAYKKPISVYGEQQAKDVLDKWTNDVNAVQAFIDKSKEQHPELADKIEGEGMALKNSLMPPLYDNKFSAKLAQDMRKHLDNLAVKQQNADTYAAASQFKTTGQQLAGSQFSASLSNLLNTPNTVFDNQFGDYVYNDKGQEFYAPVQAIAVSASDLTKYGVKDKLHNPNGSYTNVKDIPSDRKFIVVRDVDNTVKEVYPVNDNGVSAFVSKYQQPFKRKEDEAKGQIGTYDFSGGNGSYNVTPNQQEVKVSTKTTNGTSQSNKTVKPAPKKEETVTYVLNGKSGVIPKSQEAAFIKKYPKAKKM